MARQKGQYGRSSYGATVSGNILKEINLMQSSGETVRPAGTTDETSSVLTQEQRRARRKLQLTPEQIAADPVLSGRLSVDQAKINYIRSQQALNLMPLASKTGTKNRAQLKKAYAALAALKVNAIDAERQFFALGGQLNSINSKGGNYGSRGDDILAYYRSAGMEDKGYEIVAKMYGNDRYGNPVAQGGLPTVDYRLRPDSTKSLQSPIRNLTALQAARLTKLKNLKQGGATLGQTQMANLKKLRALAKG